MSELLSIHINNVGLIITSTPKEIIKRRVNDKEGVYKNTEKFLNLNIENQWIKGIQVSKSVYPVYPSPFLSHAGEALLVLSPRIEIL
jgi:hypothetical protein